jgi:hypothetical protein
MKEEERKKEERKKGEKIQSRLSFLDSRVGSKIS